MTPTPALDAMRAKTQELDEAPHSANSYRKKPVVIDATQWFVNGDHPEDYPEGHPTDWEGKVVRYYRRPDDDAQRKCQHCRETMHVHGWIDTKEGGHIVCPGDWVITGVAGERYPCKPDIFEATYEPANARTDAPRYEAMLGVAVDALESVENCADRAGVEIARAALAKIEEMAS